MGLFSLIEETTLLPKSTDKNLFTKIAESCGAHPSFKRNKNDPRDVFSIAHYAGDVEYEIKAN